MMYLRVWPWVGAPTPPRSRGVVSLGCGVAKVYAVLVAAVVLEWGPTETYGTYASCVQGVQESGA